MLLVAVFAGAWLLFAGIKKLVKSEGAKSMNSKLGKVIIVLVLIGGIGVVVAMKNRSGGAHETPQLQAAPSSAASEDGGLPSGSGGGGIPKLVDLGASTCIPCKLMAPILEELRAEFQGRFDVVFIDVRENPEESGRYGISIIPTQIFYDGTGEELFRHEGFFSREDILNTWERLGFDFTREAAAPEEAVAGEVL